MTVFAAAPQHAAHLERDWTPSQGALTLDLQPLPDGGSVIFPEAVGYLPILKGRLNPKRDAPVTEPISTPTTSRSTTASPNPSTSPPAKKLRLTDANGHETLLRILDVVGRSALIEYRALPSSRRPRSHLP